AIPILLLTSLASSSSIAAQSSVKGAPSPVKSTASAKCHALLVEFQGKDENYFAPKTDGELSEIDNSIDDCLRNSYLQLPRLDLAVAGEVAAMVAQELQSRLDRGAYEALLKNYIDLQAKTAPKPSNARTVNLTI